MRDQLQTCKNSPRLLDTLAQKRTTNFAIVHGEGSAMTDYTASSQKSKRKTISQKLALSLIDVATKKKKTDRLKSYWNTYYCRSHLIGHSGRLYGNYCKNRFCTGCCAIRKAKIINKYLQHIDQWDGCHFLTLTIKSIPAKELPRYFKGMLQIFKKIVDKHNKRKKRGKGILLQGIRSLECNFNPNARTYNPHFHVIVRTKEMGEIILGEWLKRFPRKHVQPWAQKLTPIVNKEQGLSEILKYGSKIFTGVENKKKSRVKSTPYIFASALDSILTAMKGRRIFDRFGFNLSPEKGKSKTKKTTLLTKFDEWIYHPKISDWVKNETCERLTNSILEHELIFILENNIEVDLQ